MMPHKRTYTGFNIVALFCLIAGLILLGENYGLLPQIHKLWPLATLSLGAGFILLFKERRFESLLIGIGSYLICFSILALVCNYTSWWILRDVWPTFIGFLGISLLMIYIFGTRHILYLGLALGMFSVSIVFFFVFSIDPELWPLSLVLFGICVIIINLFQRREGG